MRSLLLMTTAIVLGLGTWAEADSPDRHKGKRPDREQMRQRMLEKYDANKDGKLDDAEKKAMKEARAKHRKKGHEHHAHPGKDRDCKKSPSAKHRKEWHKRMLKKYDANKDGKLDDAEKKAMKKAMKKARAKHSKKAKDKPKTCPSGKAPKRAHGGDWHKRMLKKYDANKDGKLDEAEKKAAHKALAERREQWKKKALEKYDANKDGKLDEAERKVMRKAREARVKKWTEQRVQSTSTKIIKKLDGNDDGKLNADEVPEKYRDRFGKTDTNHDGYIDQQELQKAMLAAAEKMREEARRRMEEHGKRREAIFKKLMAGDANGDGKLNVDEASERLRAKFGKVDKNHDGYIEKEELKRHFRRHHGSHSHKKKH